MTDVEQTISIQPGYVLIERPPDYEVNWEDQSEKLREISALCKEHGCPKILVRGPKTKVKLSMIEILRLGQEIAKSRLRVAVVERHDATDQDVRFLESVTAGRGGAIQFFDNEQDAKDWLGV